MAGMDEFLLDAVMARLTEKMTNLTDILTQNLEAILAKLSRMEDHIFGLEVTMLFLIFCLLAEPAWASVKTVYRVAKARFLGKKTVRFSL